MKVCESSFDSRSRREILAKKSTEGLCVFSIAQVLGSLTEFQGEDGTFHGIDAVIANGTFIPCPSEAPTAAPAAPETYGERAAGFVFGVTTAMVATIGTLVACVLSL
jgi:hypothetical protein